MLKKSACHYVYIVGLNPIVRTWASEGMGGI